MKEVVSSYQVQFSGMSPEEMLAIIIGRHAGKFVFTSSMSAEDQVVTHMLCNLTDNADIVTLDTGRMFYETYDLIDRTNDHFGISIRAMFPDSGAVERMVLAHGVNLFYDSVEKRKMCCGVRKIEPLCRALKNKEVWITGLRSEQSPTRHKLKAVVWDEANGLIKVNPLLHWTHEQVWDYIRAHKIPYNPLHDKGFPSLGCKPCTRAVKPGEDIRAGRWWWEQPETKECGLHPGVMSKLH